MDLKIEKALKFSIDQQKGSFVTCKKVGQVNWKYNFIKY